MMLQRSRMYPREKRVFERMLRIMINITISFE
jgi:hypothetical protein